MVPTSLLVSLNPNSNNAACFYHSGTNIKTFFGIIFIVIYLFNFTKVLIKNLPNYTIYKLNLVFPKRFNFVQRLEHQVSKIVVLFIIKKLNQIILIKPFFNKKIKVTNFLCFYKINMREYIEII